jgi:hypothetical protein
MRIKQRWVPVVAPWEAERVVAYREGFQRGQSGLGGQNPYVVGSDQWRSWHTGWSDGLMGRSACF